METYFPKYCRGLKRWEKRLRSDPWQIRGWVGHPNIVRVHCKTLHIRLGVIMSRHRWRRNDQRVGYDYNEWGMLVGAAGVKEICWYLTYE